MKVYKLVIMFDPESEEVEFIEESVANDSNEEDIVIDVDVAFDDDFLDIIAKAGECGIA